METQALVVGAGISGLSAANKLKNANIPFALIEARERNGGRLFTRKYDNNIYLDLGGQWLGPGQDHCYKLTQDLGIKTFPTYNTGKNITAINNKRKCYTGLIPKLPILSLLNIDYVLKKLDRLAKKLDPAMPWAHSQSFKWDSITLASFLDRNILFNDARKVVDAGLNTLFALENNEISLLQALFYIRSGKDLTTLLSIEQGAQQDKLIGGAQQICDKKALEFLDSIFYDQALQSVEDHGSYLLAQSKSMCFKTQKIILAIPPVMINEINFNPTFEPDRKQLLQRFPMGNVIKCHSVYKEAFWRNQGLSGQSVCDERYPMQVTFDNSPVDNAYGTLTSFCMGKRADDLISLSNENRQDRVTEALKKLFGPRAAENILYADKCWAEEPFSGGCYVGMRTPGAWTRYKNLLSKPFGNIHFAGTETSSIWNGYIEGGILAGYRAAEEVLNSFKVSAS